MRKLPFIALSLSLALSLRAADLPKESDLKSLSKNSLVSFGEAVKKKDFSEFYDDIAALWQKQTTAEKLKDSFKSFLDKEIDLPAAIEGKEPIFNQPAAVDSDDVLTVQGYYPTKPNRIVFRLKYLEEDGD